MDETGPKLKFPLHNFETQVTIDLRLFDMEKGGGRERERKRAREKSARAVSYKIFCVLMLVRMRATDLSVSILYRPIDLSDVRARRGSRTPFSLRRNEKRAVL